LENFDLRNFALLCFSAKIFPKNFALLCFAREILGVTLLCFALLLAKIGVKAKFALLCFALLRQT
jgi:hypothetical protein